MGDGTTKGKIMETMYRLVAERGYDKASIGQISEAIGIKKASVYYYFKSKEDIFLQMARVLYKDDYRDREAILESDISADGYQVLLVETGEAFIDSYFENPDLRKVYAEIDLQTTRIAALKEMIDRSDERFNRFMMKCMLRGVEVGAFPKDFDAKLNAEILYAILIGIDQAILYDLPIEPKAVWRESVSRLFERKALPQV
ncbi:MAG: TetR/AcrR family transcriptional regulator [Clostridia bacterium]